MPGLQAHLNFMDPEVIPPHVWLPAVPRYASYVQRYLSFQDWPTAPSAPPATELAKAGFYATGHPDATRCFHCGGLLHHWKADEDPWEQHAIHFHHCGYLLLVKGKSYIDSVLQTSPREQPLNEVEEISSDDDSDSDVEPLQHEVAIENRIHVDDAVIPVNMHQVLNNILQLAQQAALDHPRNDDVD